MESSQFQGLNMDLDYSFSLNVENSCVTTETVVAWQKFPDVKQRLLLLALLLLFIPTRAQQLLRGEVFSAADSTALFGASVYFDGTSIGVSTDSEGRFELEKSDSNTSPLIISSLGHETIALDPASLKAGELPRIYLKLTSEELAAVFLENDPWGHTKKLGIFIREFLGVHPSAQKCKILNDEVLQLHYNPSTETLTASAKEPLVIRNRYLGYEISYNLTDFKVEFTPADEGFQRPKLVYTEGTSFFTSLRKHPRKQVRKNRKNSYEGSSLHFMRSLSAAQLRENRFRIFHKSYQVPEYKFFDLKKEGTLTRVNILTDSLTLLYGDLEQSKIIAREPFYIDEMGNHTPPTAVIFGGEIAYHRISLLLPLDYRPEEEEPREQE